MNNKIEKASENKNGKIRQQTVLWNNFLFFFDLFDLPLDEILCNIFMNKCFCKKTKFYYC